MKNLGLADRVIRLIIAIILALLCFAVGKVLDIIFIVIAVILLLEALFGWCPIYALLGISTAKPKLAKPTTPAVPPVPAPSAPKVRAKAKAAKAKARAAKRRR
ncbi:MAG: DUF2892 domain-containing protein [Candidatus Pacearchaeota archaeon]